MAITASMVAELRAKTDAPMMECKKALTEAEGDMVKAEELLRRCLDADLYHGLAHNNLGVLLLAKGEVYSAVQEFEWARKLLPGHPDPRVNLAVALAQADKTSDAMEAAKAALEVQPGYIPAIQTLSYLQISTLQSDEQTDGLLASVVERGESDAWKDWARAERLKLAARRDLLK